MNKSFIFFILVFYSVNVFAQVAEDSSLSCLRPHAVKAGAYFEDKHHFNKFGLLLQDTCSYFNRFSAGFYFSVGDKSVQSHYKSSFYTAILIDPALASFLENALSGHILKVNANGDSVHLDNPSRKLKKCIRLYNGFINDRKDTCIVVQYLTTREYNSSNFYSKQMDLIAHKGRQLKFAIFRKEGDRILIEGCFPATLFDR